MSHRAFTTRRHSRGMRRLRARPPPQKHRSSPVRRGWFRLSQRIWHTESDHCIEPQSGAQLSGLFTPTRLYRATKEGLAQVHRTVWLVAIRALYSSIPARLKTSGQRWSGGRGARDGQNRFLPPPPCPGEHPARPRAPAPVPRPRHLTSAGTLNSLLHLSQAGMQPRAAIFSQNSISNIWKVAVCS